MERGTASELGRSYAWPGNVRELEQCVRNVLVRGTYRPHSSAPSESTDARTTFAGDVAAGSRTADELLRRYAALVFADTGSYQETAPRLGIDRRTVRAKVDPALAAALRRAWPREAAPRASRAARRDRSRHGSPRGAAPSVKKPPPPA